MRVAMARLDELPAGPRVLFVTDDEERVCGSLTDGDMRRALLRGSDLDTPVSTVMHLDFAALRPGDDCTRSVARCRERKITLLPRLDENDRCISILDLQKLRAMLPLEAVLMAGGKGERLRPLTEKIPKPLLTVGGKPIIDYNVEALRANGVERIYATVNYLAEQLEQHFDSPDQWAVRCVRETKRMGTFGSLSLVPTPVHDHLLVMNSDLLTDIDFEAMYLRHIDTAADLTMAVVPYSVSVPFAIVETDAERVTGLREKPVYNYFANAGVYIMRTSLLSRIPADSYVDAPDFIDSLMADGLKVSWFPVEGMWIDIGSPDDYRRADEIMNRAKAR